MPQHNAERSTIRGWLQETIRGGEMETYKEKKKVSKDPIQIIKHAETL